MKFLKTTTLAWVVSLNLAPMSSAGARNGRLGLARNEAFLQRATQPRPTLRPLAGSTRHPGMDRRFGHERFGRWRAL